MKNQTQQSPKILIRSPNWVGDAVMATPVPRALKRTLPDCQVHILAKSWVAPIWERHPDVDRIIVMDPEKRRGLWRWISLVMSLRNSRYNLAIILPNSFSAAWLAFWAGCQVRVGYSSDHRAWLLNKKLPWTNGTRHLARPQAYLNLARAAGADVDLCQERIFTLKISPEESAKADKLLGPKIPRCCIGLAPGSVAPSRRWPTERYAQLADRLIKQGYQVVLVGSQEDRRLALAVDRRARNKLLILAGETNLREGLAVIRRLDLLVGNDSGAMHLAYAQGTKVLVLQGAADPQVTGPFGNCGFVLRDENLKCSPCVRNECPRKDMKCMRNISVNQVWQKIQGILSGSVKSG